MASQPPGLPASPLTLHPPPLAHSRPRERHSHFIETPMYEYTPANSLYDVELETEDDERAFTGGDNDVHRTTARLLLRGVNTVLHLVACVLLLTIMALFVDDSQKSGWWRQTEGQTVVLMALLVVDVLVDALTAVRTAQRATYYPPFVLVLRLLLGLAYLVLFMVDVGLGSVFSPGYTFWGLPENMAGPVVYFFLWMLGVWDLLQVVVHRHELGGCWRRRAERRAAPAVRDTLRPTPTPPIALRPQPGQGLPPPEGLMTTPPQTAPTSKDHDKPLSSGMSSASTTASMSTQTTRVEGKHA